LYIFVPVWVDILACNHIVTSQSNLLQRSAFVIYTNNNLCLFQLDVDCSPLSALILNHWLNIALPEKLNQPTTVYTEYSLLACSILNII